MAPADRSSGPIAFLDRDGTINRAAAPGEYIESWREFELLPRVPKAIRLLREAGLRVVVVTNQRGIALGRMSAEDVADIHSRMGAELERLGAPIDAVYCCPHEKGSCDCRKPNPGMLIQAARE